jgi:hypothetical protein
VRFAEENDGLSIKRSLLLMVAHFIADKCEEIVSEKYGDTDALVEVAYQTSQTPVSAAMAWPKGWELADNDRDCVAEIDDVTRFGLSTICAAYAIDQKPQSLNKH